MFKKTIIMNAAKYSQIAFWFLVIINVISLLESVLLTNGFSILKQPEFQNLLLLAVLHKLWKNKDTTQNNADPS
tara:strand:+ start:1488 stop:1709 length:222 start_codon:yes stop_codon:yes gene_type:complete